MLNRKLFRRVSDSSSSSLSSSKSDSDKYDQKNQKGEKIDVASTSHPITSSTPSIPSIVVGIGNIADVDANIRTFIRQLMESPCSVGSDKARKQHVSNLVYRRCAWLDLPETEDASSREMYEMYNEALKESVTFFARKGVKGNPPSVLHDRASFCKHLRAVFSYLNEYFLVRKGLPKLDAINQTPRV